MLLLHLILNELFMVYPLLIPRRRLISVETRIITPKYEKVYMPKFISIPATAIDVTVKFNISNSNIITLANYQNNFKAIF